MEIFMIWKSSISTFVTLKAKIIACRKQFPIKLGYATTVDRSQGRTIPSLVVDAYNFWKPAQLGVAVG